MIMLTNAENLNHTVTVDLRAQFNIRIVQALTEVAKESDSFKSIVNGLPNLSVLCIQLKVQSYAYR